MGGGAARTRAGTRAGSGAARAGSGPALPASCFTGSGPAPRPPPAPGSHVERTLETFCNMNMEMQASQNIGKINKQVGGRAAAAAALLVLAPRVPGAGGAGDGVHRAPAGRAAPRAAPWLF